MPISPIAHHISPIPQFRRLGRIALREDRAGLGQSSFLIIALNEFSVEYPPLRIQEVATILRHSELRYSRNTLLEQWKRHLSYSNSGNQSSFSKLPFHLGRRRVLSEQSGRIH